MSWLGYNQEGNHLSSFCFIKIGRGEVESHQIYAAVVFYPLIMEMQREKPVLIQDYENFS